MRRIRRIRQKPEPSILPPVVIRPSALLPQPIDLHGVEPVTLSAIGIWVCGGLVVRSMCSDVLYWNGSDFAAGIPADTDHLVHFFCCTQLLARELRKSYRLIYARPLDMTAYYGEFLFLFFFDCSRPPARRTRLCHQQQQLAGGRTRSLLGASERQHQQETDPSPFFFHPIPAVLPLK